MWHVSCTHTLYVVNSPDIGRLIFLVTVYCSLCWIHVFVCDLEQMLLGYIFCGVVIEWCVYFKSGIRVPDLDSVYLKILCYETTGSSFSSHKNGRIHYIVHGKEHLDAAMISHKILVCVTAWTNLLTLTRRGVQDRDIYVLCHKCQQCSGIQSSGGSKNRNLQA